jgi:hypothetical protein
VGVVVIGVRRSAARRPLAIADVVDAKHRRGVRASPAGRLVGLAIAGAVNAMHGRRHVDRRGRYPRAGRLVCRVIGDRRPSTYAGRR